ncbi:MAG TPA: PilZ domain-containing protein [Nitrospiria bacterium]
MKRSTVSTRNTAAPKDGIQAFIEKRRSLRKPLFVLEVKWKQYDKVFIGHTNNISIGGMFMSTTRPVKVGEQFPVEFVLPDQKTKIQCTGEVTWTRPYPQGGDGSEGIGLRFVNIDERKLKAIGEWLQRQEGPKKGA